jgi:AbiV family abortive infection protein
MAVIRHGPGLIEQLRRSRRTASGQVGRPGSRRFVPPGRTPAPCVRIATTDRPAMVHPGLMNSITRARRLGGTVAGTYEDYGCSPWQAYLQHHPRLRDFVAVGRAGAPGEGLLSTLAADDDGEILGVGTALSPTTPHRVDTDAVREADRRVLVGYAAAVAGNARDLLGDAEFLLAAGRWARAYSLAMLASEEWAKAYAVLTLSFMPPAVRAQVPVRDFLEGHRLKFMGALLLRLLDGARPGVAGRVAGMAGLADALRTAEQQADDANTAKQRGLYADLLANGALSLPSDISAEEAATAVAQAREVGAAAALLHDPDALAAFANPSSEARALAGRLFGSWLDARGIDNADAAADLIRGLTSSLATTRTPPKA